MRKSSAQRYGPTTLNISASARFDVDPTNHGATPAQNIRITAARSASATIVGAI